MSAQWGLVTRQQALKVGMSAAQILRLLRNGSWTTVHRGVYAESRYVDSLASHAEQRLLVDRAVSLRTLGPHAFSHHSAAYLLDLPVLREPEPTTHLTRPGLVGKHRRDAVAQHLAPYPDEQTRDVHGVCVLNAERTALDIVREHGYLSGLVAVDSALRMGVTKLDLYAVLSTMYCWPRSNLMRDVIESASPDTDSVGETLLRDIVRSFGFGEPEVQFGLTADGRSAWCDLRLGRHFFEFDGYVKIVGIDQGGYARQPASGVLWEEKTRQDFVTGFKTGVSRATWDDVFGPGLEQGRSRMLREFLDTSRRFGTDISDLEQFRPREPRRRPLLRPAPRGLVGWERWAA